MKEQKYYVLYNKNEREEPVGVTMFKSIVNDSINAGKRFKMKVTAEEISEEEYLKLRRKGLDLTDLRGGEVR